MGLNVDTAAEVQTKVEWLKIFLVGFYGTVLALLAAWGCNNSRGRSSRISALVVLDDVVTAQEDTRLVAPQKKQSNLAAIHSKVQHDCRLPTFTNMAILEKVITILSIDGGGMRGVIPAMVLKHLNQLIVQRLKARNLQPQPLVKFFDIVAGTSTGAIIATGLAGCKGRDRRPLATPDELVDFYETDAARVFHSHGLGLLRPKFRRGRTELKRRLNEICGEARLSDAAAYLVIPAFMGKGAFLFRGGSVWRRRSEPDYYLRDVLLATTAAPYLFPPARIAAIGRQEVQAFMDGGLFANNPALHAYLAARELFSFRREILLLSLGTGNDFHPIDYHEAFRWGGMQLLNPLKGLPLIQAMMQGQSHDTHCILQRLIPDQHSYVRLDLHSNAPLPAFDNASATAMQLLRYLAEKLIAQNAELLVGLSDRLVSNWARAGVAWGD